MYCSEPRCWLPQRWNPTPWRTKKGLESHMRHLKLENRETEMKPVAARPHWSDTARKMAVSRGSKQPERASLSLLTDRLLNLCVRFRPLLSVDLDALVRLEDAGLELHALLHEPVELARVRPPNRSKKRRISEPWAGNGRRFEAPRWCPAEEKLERTSLVAPGYPAKAAWSP